MAHKDQDQKQRKIQFQTPKIIKIAIWATISIIIVIMSILWVIKSDFIKQSASALPTRTAIDYPLCAGPEIYELRNGGKKANIKLYNGCWSGWVMLPAQVNFMVDTLSPGDLEYKFWNGKRILVPDKQAAWLGDISHSSFRLRGNGEAIITVEKNSDKN